MPRVDARIVLSLALLLLLALSAAAAPYSFGSPAGATGAAGGDAAELDAVVDAALTEMELSDAVGELRRERFAVRDVAIESLPNGSLQLRLVLSNGRRAERLDIEVTPDVGEVVAFTREPFEGKVERRIYGGADALLGIVADGASLSVDTGCSSYFVSARLGETDAYLDAEDYYVVRHTERGPRAGQRLAEWLGGELAGGAALVSVQPNTDGAAVDFELVDSGDQPVSVRAEIDDRGRITAAEVRERGGWGARWQRYHGAGRLARTLRGRRAVRALLLRDQSVVFTLAGGASYVLYQEDFEQQEYEGDCGC